MENKIQKKPRKKPNTDIQRFLDKELKHSDFLNFDYGDFFEAMYENDYLDEQLIESLSKKATEISIYKALKNNKHFQKHIEKLMKCMAQNALGSIKKLKRETERNKIWEEKERIRNEKRAEKTRIQEEKKYEKIKRENAQKAIFAASLTSTQKKAMKKFHGIDINKYNV
jgi:hypothetical protein